MDAITDLMDVNLSELREMVMDRDPGLLITLILHFNHKVLEVRDEP